MREIAVRFCVVVAIGLFAVATLKAQEVPTSETKDPAIANNEDAAEMHTNRLIDETSPYLLQHAHNPVDWYPWGEEAFAKAKREGKPIFLSVGYSTCYWCHVMEIESFEDPEVAAVINKYFVPIKVDREERPDIDEQYMLATQLMTQRGGWPNSVWLLPDGRPWMAGTYFPKQRFLLVLEQVADFWKNRRDDVMRQADSLAKATAEINESARGETTELRALIVDRAAQQLLAQFDATHGGFGGAPKFPPHGTLALLIDRYERTKDPALLEPITKTLDAMWLGGVHDHIGGGFHRYATDTHWLLPHFEKMLYDNAQLLMLYADAYALTSNDRYRDAIEDIYAWLSREMTSPGGAFYSAIDSGEVGKEGEAYVWSAEQLNNVLDDGDATWFSELYGFRQEGNFHEESTGELTGKNIPHLAASLKQTAADRSVSLDALKRRAVEIRGRLLKERLTWPQPHKDDKILASWNGLTIAALARAGSVLGDPKFGQAAIDAATFIDQQMMRNGKLLRTYREGVAKQPAYLDDYAYMCRGFLELHHLTGDNRWLDRAKVLADVMLKDFQDAERGGFFYTGDDYEALIVRSRGLGGGGNLPNANGVAAQVMMRLSELSGDSRYREAAGATLRSFAGQMAGQPHTNEDLLVAVAERLQRPLERDDGPIAIQTRLSQSDAKPGQQIELRVTLSVDDGWHVYADNPDVSFVVPTTVDVSTTAAIIVGSVSSPEPERKSDSVIDSEVKVYTGNVPLTVPLTVVDSAAEGVAKLKVTVKYQACDDRRCLKPEVRTIDLVLNLKN